MARVRRGRALAGVWSVLCRSHEVGPPRGPFGRADGSVAGCTGGPCDRCRGTFASLLLWCAARGARPPAAGAHQAWHRCFPCGNTSERDRFGCAVIRFAGACVYDRARRGVCGERVGSGCDDASARSSDGVSGAAREGADGRAVMLRIGTHRVPGCGEPARVRCARARITPGHVLLTARGQHGW